MATEVRREKTINRTLFELVESRGLFSGQKFHVRISDVNGQILYYTEKYVRLDDAQTVMDRAINCWADTSL